METKRIEEEREENKNISTIVLIIILLIILIFSVATVSFATLRYANKGLESNTILTGQLSMSYHENSEGILITDAYPMTDEAGMNLIDTPTSEGNYTTRNTFRFSVSASINGPGQIQYEISAMKQEVEGPALENTDVKLYLAQILSNGDEQMVMAPKHYTPIDSVSTLGSPAGSMILTSGSFLSNRTDQYILKMWLDKDYDTSKPGGAFSVKLNVYGKGV